MKKCVLIILTLLFANSFFAQNRINLNKAVNNSFVLTEAKNANTLLISTSLSYISPSTKSTDNGNFIAIESEGLMETFDLGKPNIPVYSKLIEVPIDAAVKFNVISYDEEIVDLKTKGISEKIIPSQPSISKSEEPDSFYYDRNIYNENKYFNTKIADYEEAGIMRSVRLGRVILNPIQYNPVENKLRILNNLKVEIQFVGSNKTKTLLLKAKYANRLFDNVIESYTQRSAIQTQTANSDIITYVIVADRMFESTLSLFITYKRSLGYKVIVGYTDSPDVGSTTASIKAYLENLYNNPAAGYSPPLYVLLVGDIQQIPSFSSNGHVTDLYYFDYTNDNLPDVYYGRFSATTTAQLKPQIDKTMEYEKYSMPDPSYLFNALLVAGADYSHQLTYGNGQVNYLTNEYFNSNNGITAYAYLQPEPSGGNYSANIISKINSGVGFANYTAHCGPNGWADPSFSTSNIASLTNDHKYGLWIGNCCQSCKFDVTECFGEAVLRAANKGAVGYIGGTDNTYWNEDFWWGVGFKTVSANPSYNPNHLGAFDKLFHTHGEAESNWCSRQGQLLMGGNLAVQESTSSMKKYYWEIYHLLGDPSLNIRFVPQVNCEENLVINTNISGGTHEYLASNSITASNTISGNAVVHYGANNSVTLSGGFKLEQGSNFVVDPHGCTNDNSNSVIQNTASSKNSELLYEASLSEDSKESFIRVYADPLLDGVYSIEINDKDLIPESVVISGVSGSKVYRNCNLDNIFIIRNITEKDIQVRVNFADNYIVKKINICKTNK